MSTDYLSRTVHRVKVVGRLEGKELIAVMADPKNGTGLYCDALETEP